MRGGGTSSNPYIVDTDADLKALGTNISTYASAYIELGVDITCSGNQTPIGDSSTPFTGHFDGKNHTITNLNVSGVSYQGLFGQCGSSFSIKNLKLVNGHVTATDRYCGMLIGYVYQASGAVVENIETDGCKVDSNSYAVGGIVGNGANSCSGSVTYRNCYVHDGYVAVISPKNRNSYYVGGIVGLGANYSSGSILYENCRVLNEYVCNIGSYSGYYTGGIVGVGANTNTSTVAQVLTISGCEVRDCVIKISDYGVGGIVGVGAITSNNNNATCNVYDCGVYNTVVWSTFNNSSSDGKVGGISGGVSGYSSSYKAIMNIERCIVDRCTICAGQAIKVGGIIGGSNNTSYSTITIKKPTVRDCSVIGRSDVGGMVGSN